MFINWEISGYINKLGYQDIFIYHDILIILKDNFRNIKLSLNKNENRYVTNYVFTN